MCFSSAGRLGVLSDFMVCSPEQLVGFPPCYLNPTVSNARFIMILKAITAEVTWFLMPHIMFLIEYDAHCFSV